MDEQNFFIWILCLFAVIPEVKAEVDTYAPVPIRYEVKIQYVVTETIAGERAKGLGNGSDRVYVENQIVKILAQAGIGVSFEPAVNTWVNNYAHEGDIANTEVRTTADLRWIFDNIPQQFYSQDEGTITVVFCKRPPGWGYRGFFQTNGYAYIGWNGVTFFLGDGMLRNNGNKDIVAAVLAHEIGHNLGLRHLSVTTNLMNPTIFEGFLEDDQISSVLDRNKTLGLLATTGFPELQLEKNRTGTGFTINHERSLLSLGLQSSSSLQQGDWNGITTQLRFGIHKSREYRYADNDKLFFNFSEGNSARSVKLPAPFVRDRNPHNCQGIACGKSLAR